MTPFIHKCSSVHYGTSALCSLHMVSDSDKRDSPTQNKIQAEPRQDEDKPAAKRVVISAVWSCLGIKGPESRSLLQTR